MYADGKYVVDMENMSIRLSGLTRDRLSQIWGKPVRPQTPDGFKPAILRSYQQKPVNEAKELICKVQI